MRAATLARIPAASSCGTPPWPPRVSARDHASVLGEIPIETLKGASPDTNEPQTPKQPCPCCGGPMIIIETFQRGCSPRYRTSARHQDRHLMSPFALSPAKSLIHCGRRPSTSDASARASAALAPQLTHPFSLLDALAPITGNQLVHLSCDAHKIADGRMSRTGRRDIRMTKRDGHAVR
jgi:hypothetical protein